MNVAATLLPILWKALKPVLKKASKNLRDKWAKELADETTDSSTGNNRADQLRDPPAS